MTECHRRHFLRASSLNNRNVIQVMTRVDNKQKNALTIILAPHHLIPMEGVFQDFV